MSEFHIPIASSDLRKVLPSGQDIQYSTLCRGTARKSVFWVGKGSKERIYTWITPLLVTNKGIAVSIPLELTPAKNNKKDLETLVDLYFTWEHAGLSDPNIPQKEKDRFGIIGLISTNKIYGISNEHCQFNLIRDRDSESKDDYNKRVTEFYEKFIIFPRQIASANIDKIYEVLKNNPKMKQYAYEKKYGSVSVAHFWFVKEKIKKEEKLRIKQQKAEEKHKKKIAKHKKKNKI